MHNIVCASSPQQALTADQMRANCAGLQDILEAFQTVAATAASKHGKDRGESKEAYDMATGTLQSERTQVKKQGEIEQRVEEGIEAALAHSIATQAITLPTMVNSSRHAQDLAAQATNLPEMVNSSRHAQELIAQAITLPAMVNSSNQAEASIATASTSL